MITVRTGESFPLEMVINSPIENCFKKLESNNDQNYTTLWPENVYD